MITCPICGAQNDPLNRFCDQCGARIEPGSNAPAAPPPPSAAHPAAMNCPQCNTPVLPGQAFCDNCGSDLMKINTGAAVASEDEETVIISHPPTGKSRSPESEETMLAPQSHTETDSPSPPSSYTEETMLAPQPPADEDIAAPPPAAAPPPPSYNDETVLVPQPPAETSPPPASYADETVLAEPSAPPPEPPSQTGAPAPEPPEPSDPPPAPIDPSLSPTPPELEAEKGDERKRLEDEVQRHRGTVEQMEKMLQSYPTGGQTPEFLIQGLEGARRALTQAEARLAALSSEAKTPDPAEIQRLQTLINVHKDTIAQFEQMKKGYPPDAIPSFLIEGLNEANRALVKTKADLVALRGEATEPFAGPAPDAPEPEPEPAPTPPPAEPAASSTPAPELPSAPAKGPRLELFEGKHVFPLPQDKAEIIVGRADPVSYIYPEVDLTAVGGEAGGVSRQHARIVFNDGQWTITDLHSTNHTRVEGKKVEPDTPTPIQDGTRLQFGRIAAIFRL